MSTVFILEDDAQVLETLVESFKLRGHTVGYSTTVEGACSAWLHAEEPWDLVIADYELPDGRGTEFLNEVVGRGPKTILWSGLHRAREVEREMPVPPDLVTVKSDFDNVLEYLR